MRTKKKAATVADVREFVHEVCMTLDHLQAPAHAEQVDTAERRTVARGVEAALNTLLVESGASYQVAFSQAGRVGGRRNGARASRRVLATMKVGDGPETLPVSAKGLDALSRRLGEAALVLREVEARCGGDVGGGNLSGSLGRALALVR